VQELVKKIRAEIQSHGAIPFHDFMQMALYCPVYGYYEKESDNIGSTGDFFTSQSVGPLFGQLLAFQFSEWLTCPEFVRSVHRLAPASGSFASPPLEERAGERRPPTHLVEAGAHEAFLARDILTWIEAHRPALFQTLEYWLIEPSQFRRSRQQQALAPFAGKVHWAERLPAPGFAQQATDPPIFRGIIFSNELLDAFPVHRLGWDAQQHSWFEWGVTFHNDQFVWTRLSRLSSEAAQLAPEVPEELSRVLPDGFTTEVSPSALEWWRQAAASLAHGKLLAIDYGLEAHEFLEPHRAQGTLRAYRRHRPAADILENPGQQDITAHVNFSVLRDVGQSFGLVSEPLQTQAQFLTRIFEKVAKGQPDSSEWTQGQTRQFQTLTHPDHLGRAFRVLMQTTR
jgi:SAM-dependent MidA family methyltransferase